MLDFHEMGNESVSPLPSEGLINQQWAPIVAEYEASFPAPVCRSHPTDCRFGKADIFSPDFLRAHGFISLQPLINNPDNLKYEMKYSSYPVI